MTSSLISAFSVSSSSNPFRQSFYYPKGFPTRSSHLPRSSTIPGHHAIPKHQSRTICRRNHIYKYWPVHPQHCRARCTVGFTIGSWHPCCQRQGKYSKRASKSSRGRCGSRRGSIEQLPSPQRRKTLPQTALLERISTTERRFTATTKEETQRLRR
jgi:hypothetical protein